MRWLINLKVAKKLALGFAMVLVLLIVMAGFGSVAILNANRMTDQITHHQIPALTACLEVPEAVRTIQRDLRDGLLLRDKTGVASWSASYNEADKKLAGLTSAYAELAANPEERKNAEALQAAASVWLSMPLSKPRAGEHGKGFAVVADEVRKLAERSAVATKEIGSLIHKVRGGVEEAVVSMQSSGREVSEGTTRSEQAGSALIQILQSVEQVTAGVEEVSGIASQMATSVQKVVGTIETVTTSAVENERAVLTMASGAEQVSASIANVASISEETAAGAEEMSATAEEVAASTQNVSAAVEEQMASVTEVTTSVAALKNMASELQGLVDQFCLEAKPEAASPSLRFTENRRRKAA